MNVVSEVVVEEDVETREIRLRFEDVLKALKPTTNERLEKREPLIKLKRGVGKEEIERANKILEKHLQNVNDICKVVDAVYAMGKTIAERKGVKRQKNKQKRKS